MSIMIVIYIHHLFYFIVITLEHMFVLLFLACTALVKRGYNNRLERNHVKLSDGISFTDSF